MVVILAPTCIIDQYFKKTGINQAVLLMALNPIVNQPIQGSDMPF